MRALAADGEDAALERDVHARGLDAGKVHVELEPIVMLVDVDGRNPARGRAARVPIAERAEQAVDFVLELADTPRFVPDDCHGSSSSLHVH